MTGEQVSAFRHCTGDEGLALIDGQAGTGKSFTMAAIRDAYEADGHRVIGLAFTNKVAKNLAQDGFDHAATVHRELIDLNNGRTSWDRKNRRHGGRGGDARHQADGDGDRARARRRRETDPRRRRPAAIIIDGGGMFAVLKDRHGAAVLSEVKRQYKPTNGAPREMMAEGNFDAALGDLRPQGRDPLDAHAERGPRRAGREMGGATRRPTATNPALCLPTPTKTSTELNVALRAVRKERGELEWEDHELKTAHGRVRLSAPATACSSPAPTGRSASKTAVPASIEAIDGTHLAVRLDGRDGKTINFDAANFGNFRHGYAGTVWKGQGDTLDQTYLYHSEHWRSAPSYVALTRHREQTELFVATNTAEDLKALAKQVARQEENARRLGVLPARPDRAGPADDGAGNSRAIRRRAYFSAPPNGWSGKGGEWAALRRNTGRTTSRRRPTRQLPALEIRRRPRPTQPHSPWATARYARTASASG